jgi:hypothetical protein
VATGSRAPLRARRDRARAPTSVEALGPHANILELIDGVLDNAL